ncbi:glutamate racemase [Salinarimonas ramus]|uniref:Glutamate racemase n=1 Tax=Salinarimonas ramus TaxID=690164 RepID=A0A917V2I6_9HYPH|nr:glutamate racemase [Salinarimonas ramus]GGK24161.1 glutamate racemase [Salinarimonas ramus]
MTRLLVLDSGVGGLTVLSEIRRARPDAEILYLADDAFFPYGGLAEEALVARVVALVEESLRDFPADGVVVACNTASTLVLAPLRARLGIPIVGTVPAVKPAAAASQTKRFSVLATPGTVRRDYTLALIAEHAAGCAVTLVGAPRLAAYAEAELMGAPVPDADLLAEIAPSFVEADGTRTDAVVLACTHYPLLVARFERIAPWLVAWLDPAPAIARRVTNLFGESAADAPPAPAAIRFTSGRTPAPPLAEALAARGLTLARP